MNATREEDKEILLGKNHVPLCGTQSEYEVDSGKLRCI
jgi:hypothetical protein